MALFRQACRLWFVVRPPVGVIGVNRRLRSLGTYSLGKIAAASPAHSHRTITTITANSPAAARLVELGIFGERALSRRCLRHALESEACSALTFEAPETSTKHVL
jgi:hypothetical protein